MNAAGKRGAGGWVALAGLVVVFPVAFAAGAQYVVTADRVNLRASAAGESKVMGQASRGDVLEGTGAATNGYVGVVPPPSVDMWVYGELIKNGVAIVGKLHVRAGPGINYQTLGQLEKGAEVTVREEWKGWLKIAPPPHCTVWVSTDYVAPAEGAAARSITTASGAEASAASPTPPTAAPEPVADVRKPPMPRYAAGPTAASSDAPEPTAPPPASALTPSAPASAGVPAVLAGRALVPGVVQGRQVSHEGRIRPSGLIWRRPSKYRLVRDDDKGRSMTACYVLGNDEQLSAFEGRAIVIHGREYWLQGVRFSVVIPDRITIPDTP